MTRVAPLASGELDDQQRELLEGVGGASAMNIFTTLVRHPGLFRRWLPFAGKLLQGSSLPARERELVILRVAWRCGSAYEWGQHVGIAREAGLSDDEIVAAAGDDRSGDDGSLLQATDELLDDHRIADGTWAALASRYRTEQLIELTMLAGHYAMLAGTLRSLDVPVDGDLPALGSA